MRTSLLLPGILAASSLAWGQAAPPKPADADPVVLTVGAEKLTKTQFEQIMDQIMAQMPPERRAAARAPEARRQLAEQLAELKALAQAARHEKIDQTEEAKAQVSLQMDQVVARLFYQKIAKEAKPEAADLKAYYDAHKSEYESVTARHILIRMTGSPVPVKQGQKELTDEEALAKAKDLRAKITAGGNFADLAKAESDDTGSGANGGSLGEFTRGRMVPQFEEAAFKLAVNEVSEPVKTQFGYHVIQVQKHDSKSMDDVKAEIEQKIGPELAQKQIEAIKGKTTITFDQAYFGK